MPPPLPPRKKRRKTRPRLSDYGIDLPDLPGVPLQIIPLYWHAWTTIKQSGDGSFFPSFSHALDQETTHQHCQKGSQKGSQKDNSMVRTVDQILQHIHRREQDISPADTVQRQQRIWQDVNAWTAALARLQQERDQTVVALVDDLWKNRLEQHLHASLFLLHCLLTKSAAARRHWLDEYASTIVTFMDNKASNNEVLQDLRYILNEGLHQYSQYETLRRRLDQVLPPATPHVTHNREATWRQCRDMALQHAPEQQRRIRKLLQRSQTYLNVLVPRWTSNQAAADKNYGKEEEEHEDEDSVAWEDGDDEDNCSMHHEAAVARTMETMRSTGAIQNGELHIDMALHRPAEDAAQSPQSITALEGLTKCVNLLSNRYMPRLDVWVQGLTQADHLVANDSGGAWVRMSVAQVRERQDLLFRLMELKSEVATLLSSVRRWDAPVPTSVPDRAPRGTTRRSISINYHPASTRLRGSHGSRG